MVGSLLVVTAVEAEREALGRGLGEPEAVALGPYPADRYRLRAAEIVVLAAGVGPAAAAAGTATALALGSFQLVVSAGIGGAFDEHAKPGTVVEATSFVAADLGAASPKGFLSLSTLGFGPSELPATPIEVPDALRGPVLTVSTATGSATRARELAARHRAAAEAMEGFGVATAAQRFATPCAEVRTISNVVGERDRERWDIPVALAALAEVGRYLQEVEA